MNNLVGVVYSPQHVSPELYYLCRISITLPLLSGSSYSCCSFCCSAHFCPPSLASLPPVSFYPVPRALPHPRLLHFIAP
ncbi:hypothetical protein BDZ91DRAFT_726593 [Kalaharituber pfeilii]|nr:hypothetical protein BDZ91DRAFT_726593 [Kalaharituber pfeilii]